MTNREVFHVFFGVLAAFFFFQRLIEAKFHKKVKGTVSTPWLTRGMIVLHFAFLFGCIFQVYFKNNIINWNVTMLGLGIFFSGFFLRRWAIKSLGVFWSIEIEMRDKHELVTSGPYKFCRHPNYLAIILEIVGFCLIANAYQILAFTLMGYVPLLILRIKSEEVELVKKFSDTYLKYIKSTPSLIPFTKR